MGSSRNPAKSWRSPGSVFRAYSRRVGFRRAFVENVRMSAKQRSTCGARQRDQVARAAGQPRMLFVKSRAIQAPGGFRLLRAFLDGWDDYVGFDRNVQKAPKTRRNWGQWRRSQVARIVGQPYRAVSLLCSNVSRVGSSNIRDACCAWHRKLRGRNKVTPVAETLAVLLRTSASNASSISLAK